MDAADRTIFKYRFRSTLRLRGRHDDRLLVTRLRHSLQINLFMLTVRLEFGNRYL